MTTPAANRWILAALCLALLVMRISGAHLHLCFDGAEPPLSYHVADSGVHHADEPGHEPAVHDHGHDHGHGHEVGHEQSHDDRDLDVGQDVLVKKPAGKDVTLALIACALLLFLVSSPRAFLRSAHRSTVRLRSRSFLRPPLRGPPALA